MFNSLVMTAAAVLVSAWNGVLCTPLCLTGDFDSQLKNLLHEQMKSAEDLADVKSRVLNDVQPTLNQRWQGYKVIPFGSLMTGIILPSSDLDFYIQLPFNTTSRGSYVLQETYKLFEKQPQLYTNLTYYKSDDCSILKLIHIPSQRRVELMFNFGDMFVENSKLLKYYFNLDVRFLTMGKFLKMWINIQDLNGHPKPITYVLYLLIIFYLQQKNMVPPVYMIKKDSKSQFIYGWDVGFNELPYNTTNTDNLYQLLGGFFKYYSEFNYEEFVIAPFAGRPIKKSAFRDIKNFPEEYSLYDSNLQQKIKNHLNVSIAICVQDPVGPSYAFPLNEIVRQNKTEATTFKNFMKSVAKMFEDLPSECLLRALLVIDQPKKDVIDQKQKSVGIDQKQKSVGRRHE